MHKKITFALIAALLCACTLASEAGTRNGGEGGVRRVLQENNNRDAEIDAAILGVDVKKGNKVDGVRQRKKQPQHVDTKDLDAAVIDHRLRRDRAARLGGAQKNVGTDAAAEKNNKDDAPVLDVDHHAPDARRQALDEEQYNDQPDEQQEEHEEDNGPEMIYEEDNMTYYEEEEEENVLAPNTVHASDSFAQQVLHDRQQWRKKWSRADSAARRQRNLGQHGAGSGGGGGGGRDGNFINGDLADNNIDGSGGSGSGSLEGATGSIPVTLVIGMTLTMAAAAGIGALPFFFVRSLSPQWSALATSVACGVMFAASFDLIHEGQPYGGTLVVIGVFLGGAFISIMQKWLDSMEDVKFGHLHGNRARRLVLMVGTMAAHAVGEGCGVGVSFCGERGWAQGMLTTLAIGVHNVPEGLAKATMLVSQGASAPEALFWSIVTCLPQPLAAVPAFLFVEAFKALLPIALGFAAGCMIWMVFAELLPDALKDVAPSQVATFATVAAAALEGVRMGFESLEGPKGTMRVPLAGVDYAEMGPGLTAGAVMAGVATLTGSAVGGASLPTPVVLGFGAFTAAALGGMPILYQVVSNSSIPVLHTASAAVAGVAAALLLRRYLLRAAVAASGAGGGGGGSLPVHAGNGLIHSNGYSNGSGVASVESDMFGGSAGYNGSGSGGGGGRGALTRRADIYGGGPLPDSPSKAKGAGAPWSEFSGISNSNSSDGKGKHHSVLAVPSKAAGLVVAAALLAQAFPLGWQFTQQLALRIPGVAQPFGLALALRGIVAGGAARAVFGRSKVAGGILGALIAMACSSAMLSSLSSTNSSAAEVVQALSYPHGWTDTANAAACGALIMAAVTQFAVGMSISPKHARFGAVLAVLVLGGIYGVLVGGCRVLGAETACSMLSVN